MGDASWEGGGKEEGKWTAMILQNTVLFAV